MPTSPPHGGYRTGRLWAVAGICCLLLLVGTALALFGMLEFDEQCMQGLTQGPGSLQRTRDQAFPPATVCEFQYGDVTSVGGRAVLGTALWICLLVLLACVLVALVAECLDPRPGGRFVVPMTRAMKLRRTGAAFFVAGGCFAIVYALVGWRLLAGPTGACARGADWGSNAPRTLEYSLLPPQATCQYGSGMTEHLNPGWASALAAELAVPALLAAVGLALACWRWNAERREAVRTPPQATDAPQPPAVHAD